MYGTRKQTVRHLWTLSKCVDYLMYRIVLISVCSQLSWRCFHFCGKNTRKTDLPLPSYHLWSSVFHICSLTNQWSEQRRWTISTWKLQPKNLKMAPSVQWLDGVKRSITLIKRLRSWWQSMWLWSTGWNVTLLPIMTLTPSLTRTWFVLVQMAKTRLIAVG